MKNLLLVAICCCAAGQFFAQSLRQRGGSGGMFSVGQRTTVSAFNAGQGERNALGIGGQLRVRLSERVNTEWFLDYLPATNEFTRREDYHIGWSVLFYPLKPEGRTVVPYILAGHCFDYTNHVDLSNSENRINRLSSAAQAGIGTHVNLTERLDISLSSQYMIHLGTDVHSHIDDGVVRFEAHKGGSFEGHLLFTLSLNYKIADIWGRD